MKPLLSPQRLPVLLLMLALLAAQWGWLAHEHQAHDSGQVCEVCVAGASFGHGITPSATAHTLPASRKDASPRLMTATVLPRPYHHTLGQRGPPALS